MQYEKAYAELIVFGGGDVITTSFSWGGGGWDSSQEWDDHEDLHRPDGHHRPTRPGKPGRR